MLTDQKAERVQQIRKTLQERDTQYLVNVWKKNDHHGWTPEAFEAIHEILLERLGSVPAQKQRDPREGELPQERKQKILLIRFEGEIEFQYLSTEDAHQILGRLNAGLIAQKATNIRLSTNTVSFDGRISQRTYMRMPLLGLVDKGEIIVQAGAPAILKYSFSFMWSFIIVTLIAMLCFFSLLPSISSNTFAVFAIPSVIWLLGFGIHYIIAVFRLEDFVWQKISSSDI